MPRDVGVYLADIAEAIAPIRTYTDALDRGTFEADPRTVDAVLHNLAILGEAAAEAPQRVQPARRRRRGHHGRDCMTAGEDRLLRVLGIARDTSSPEGPGLSLREALELADYDSVRSSLSAEDLAPLLRSRPALIEEWLAYSEDKRTSGGYYILQNGKIGRIEDRKPRMRTKALDQAVAEYVILELDFWASVVNKTRSSPDEQVPPHAADQ